ncbi:MAG: zinc ribbon domain-containing protein [Oscillospiraceae bacterium]
MQCAYCGRDIPDDARWCPYCGAEQAPPEELQDKNIPSDGWQDDPAPPDDRHGRMPPPAGRTPPLTIGTMKPSRRTIHGPTTRRYPAGRTTRLTSPRRRLRTRRAARRCLSRSLPPSAWR